jgi:peptidoglycan/LPS O-acetylase OafA/YrhL
MYDTAALDGLRGVIAVHILLFHALLYSTLQWHIIGSAQVCALATTRPCDA